MLINRKDITRLKELSLTTDLTSVDEIPEVFKKDFELFFFGKTLLGKGDQLFAYPHDVKMWTLSLVRKHNNKQ